MAYGGKGDYWASSSARSRSPPRGSRNEYGGYDAQAGQRMAQQFAMQSGQSSDQRWSESVPVEGSGAYYNKPEGSSRVCMKFLKGECSNGRSCQNQHPVDAEEIVGWVSTFLSRPCGNKDECGIPGCLYGHPDQSPGDPPPGGWSRGHDGTPPPVLRYREALKRKWATLTEDGSLYTAGPEDDPASISAKVDRFITANKIDMRAGGQLRLQSTQIQQMVLAEGPIWGGRPSAGLMARLNKLEAQLKADGGAGNYNPVGQIRLATTTITSDHYARQMPPRVTTPGRILENAAMRNPDEGPDYSEYQLPAGLLETANQQLTASMPRKIQISHIQLPGEPTPPPITSLGAALRSSTLGWNSAPTTTPSFQKAAPRKPSLTWDQIASLSVAELHQKIRESGTTIPPGVIEKADLCAILRRALGVTS